MAAPESEPEAYNLISVNSAKYLLHEECKLRCEVTYDRKYPGFENDDLPEESDTDFADWGVVVAGASGDYALFARTWKPRVHGGQGSGYFCLPTGSFLSENVNRPAVLAAESQDEIDVQLVRYAFLSLLDRYAMTYRSYGNEERFRRYQKQVGPAFSWLWKQMKSAENGRTRAAAEEARSAAGKRWWEAKDGRRKAEFEKRARAAAAKGRAEENDRGWLSDLFGGGGYTDLTDYGPAGGADMLFDSGGY